MKRVRITLLLFAALSLVTTLHAQTCVNTDTPTTCWNKFNTVDASAFQTASATVADAVARTNTGSPDLSGITNSALRDFLSVFTAAVGKSTVTKNNGAITLDYNLPLLLMHPNDVIKLQATFAKPELDAALKTALAASPDVTSKLSGSLDETDDVTASASYSPSTKRFGRTFENHDDFIEALLQAVDIGLGTSNPNAMRAKVGDLARGTLLGPDTPFTVITNGQKQAEVLAAFEKAARAQPKYEEKIHGIIAKSANLINNQEQVYLTFKYHDLNSLAGASSWSVKGTYEMGGKNITKFVADTKCDADAILRDANADEPPETPCLKRFTDYIDDNTIDRTWRIAASLDISRINANEIAISQLATPITTPSADSQIISITAGRRFDPPTSARERRIDIEGSYQNVSDDPKLDDRLTLSLTWTQELTDALTLPITLSYANKTKYLPDDDKHLSAHFAISYKLPKTTK
jgi:hypothetical protein